MGAGNCLILRNMKWIRGLRFMFILFGVGKTHVFDYVELTRRDQAGAFYFLLSV